MKYLKKDMVKRVIELSSACADASLTSKDGVKDPAQVAFTDYLKLMGERASAELTTLMWLGRDQRKKVEDWAVMVEEARGPGIRDLFTVPKTRLGPFLRAGMERLVRANKLQQPASKETGRIIVAKESRPDAPRKEVPTAKAAPLEPKALQQRQILAGQFLLESFRNRYGDQGLSQLGKLMAANGLLISAEEKELFQLHPARIHEDLESVLNDR